MALGITQVALLYFNVLDWLGKRMPLVRSFPLRPPTRPLSLILLIGAVLVLLSKKYKVPGVYWFLKNFDRPEVMKVFPGKGLFFYIFGALVVVALFDKPIAMASIMILALGDSSSHLIGRYIGRVRHPFDSAKFVEGHIGGALIGTLGAMLFVKPLTALAAASAAMFLEGIRFWPSLPLDDNLVVPLTAGVVIFLLGPIGF